MVTVRGLAGSQVDCWKKLEHLAMHGPCFRILHWLERIIYYLPSCQVKQYLQTGDCQLPRLFSTGTVYAAAMGIVCYLDDLSVCLNNAYGGLGSRHRSRQMMQEGVRGTIYWSPLSGDNVCSSPRHWGTDCYLKHLPLKAHNGPVVPSRCLLSKKKKKKMLACQRMSTEFLSINTWTAVLSGEMTLRELEGARVHNELLGQTVAMVTAAEAEEEVAAALLLLLSSCFSPSISTVTQSQWWEIWVN